MKKEVTLVKNCIATIIPAGDEITLAEGAHFVIAQSLGGSVTLRDENGMYRVGEDQLSALGDDIVSDVVAVEEKSEKSLSVKKWYGMHYEGAMTLKFLLISLILVLFMT